MEHETLRELTAAYALDALEPEDERVLEEHLRVCAECREEVASFADTAAALAYGVEAPAPPDALRGRILTAARAERENVVPLRPRRTPVLVASAVAAVAAVAAIALGVWASSLSNSLDEEREAVRILAGADRTVALSGADGRVFVGPSGEAALVVRNLERAPADKTYEAWIIRAGKPARAGVFEGKDDRDVVKLDGTVEPGSTVAVTVEREGGVDAPTTDPIFSAQV